MNMQNFDAARAAPSNVAAEAALLGAIMVNNYTFDRISDVIGPEHFYDQLHARIFEVICKLISEKKSATPITVMPFFADAMPFDDLTTVPQYLGALVANAALTTIHAVDYARAIIEASRLRSLIIIGEDMINAAYSANAELSAAEQIEAVEQQLYKVADAALNTSSSAYGDVLQQVIASSLEAHAMGGRPVGFSTGFPDLDKRLSGLEPGQLIIIAGRPSMGKTALGMNIGVNVARKGERVKPDGEIITDAVVQVFSLEMTEKQLVTRVLASDTGIPANRIKTGALESHEVRALQLADEHYRGTRILIDETPGATLPQIAAKARRQKRQGRLDLIIVDYLQILRLGKGDNRNNQIGDITSGFKALAKELQVPIILLSQLSRENEKRSDKRPQLSDLRDSGNIEQDADVVIFVHREEYYLEKEKPTDGNDAKFVEWENKKKAAKGKAEAIAAKVREGETGIVELHWNGELTLFSSLARGDL